MHVHIDFPAITELLRAARAEGRDSLFEHEVYTLLSLSGAETPPKCTLIRRGDRFADEELTAFSGDRVVLKIVSPTIIHKTEVGGVRVVDRLPGRIRSAIRRMHYEVPEHYAALVERAPQYMPASYRGLAGEALTAAVSRDIRGVLLVQYMPPDSEAFGNELIVGLRSTREFGTIITAGLGGTDTELYAERFRKGQAIVAASTEMHDGHSFFELFRKTIAYKKLAGLTRGQRRIVTDEQLIECFQSFIRIGNHYSPLSPEREFVIEELEINPFAFTDYLMVPLDGLCRFGRPPVPIPRRPIAKIDRLLHPGSIGLIGVSATRKNFGRIILDNILAEGFAPAKLTVLHDKEEKIAGVACIKEFDQLEKPLDLLIVAVAAAEVPVLLAEIIQSGAAASVMLISGGMGETEDSRERAAGVVEMLRRAHAGEGGGPLVLGANCMGVISRPGRYDTWFIPEEKLAKDRTANYHRAALISQSGAFMLHRSHQFPELRPAYMISMGNQTDLTLGDMLQYFKDSAKVDVIAIYAEGFNDFDGLAFCRAVREAVLAGKDVIFYKAGRTAEGRAATSGHTASLAGDYMVCENCVRQAGAIVARSLSEFQELFFLAETLAGKKVLGNRLAGISGAGFEAVGMADSIESDDYRMRLAEFSPATREGIAEVLLRKNLSALVTVANPLDINPAADDEAHDAIARLVLADPGVDAVILSLDPLSPMMRTLSAGSERYAMENPDSIRARLIRLMQETDKPLVAVVDGGRMFTPLRDALLSQDIPVFMVCDRAVAVLSLYMQGRLAAESLRVTHHPA